MGSCSRVKGILTTKERDLTWHFSIALCDKGQINIYMILKINFKNYLIHNETLILNVKLDKFWKKKVCGQVTIIKIWSVSITPQISLLTLYGQFSPHHSDPKQQLICFLELCDFHTYLIINIFTSMHAFMIGIFSLVNMFSNCLSI